MRRKPSEPRREIMGIYIKQNNALQQQEVEPSEQPKDHSRQHSMLSRDSRFSGTDYQSEAASLAE